MEHKSIFVGLCIILFTVILEVELTPIVTLSPESVPTTTTTTEITQILTTSTETSISSVVRLNVTVIPEEEEDGLSEKVEGLNATMVGHIETTPILPVIIEVTGNNSSNGTVVQPVALSTTEIANLTTEQEEPTTPELILNTTTSTASTPYIEVTQFSVTSNPITLKKGSTTVQGDKLLEATASTTFVPVENQTANVTTSTSNPPVRITSVSGNLSNEAEGNYKSKAPPEYHPYIEEILRADATQNNDTTTEVVPIRIKSKGYHSSHNDVNEHPYGPLPKFAEKDMNKLRLNHWRVHQILKGDTHQDLKVGQAATGTLKKNNNMQDKYQQHLSNFLGQKRASSTASATPVMKTSIDQDEFHSSILASEHDATAEMQTEEPTKLRSFFNWISSPLKKIKPSGGTSDEDDERLKQARKQEPILPFALGYRGDFLFW